MRALARLWVGILLTGFVLLAGDVPPRIESTRTQSVAQLTLKRDTTRRESPTPVQLAAPSGAAPLQVATPDDAPRVAKVGRFLLNRALLN